MGQETVVGVQIEDGWKFIQKLAQEGFKVAAAFWLKADPDSLWYLYIVSPVVDEQGIAKAYGRIGPVIRQMPQPFWLDPFDVKLIGMKKALAKDVLALQQQYEGRAFIGGAGQRLGGSTIEGAYYYPPVPAAG